MADPSAVTIEGENYEVVDECMEEDEPLNQPENKATSSMEKEQISNETTEKNDKETQNKVEESVILTEICKSQANALGDKDVSETEIANAKIENKVSSTQDHNNKIDSILPEKKTDGIMPEKKTDGILPEKKTDGILPEKKTDGIMPEKKTDGIMPEKKTDGILPEKKTDGIMPEKKTDNPAEKSKVEEVKIDGTPLTEGSTVVIQDNAENIEKDGEPKKQDNIIDKQLGEDANTDVEKKDNISESEAAGSVTSNNAAQEKKQTTDSAAPEPMDQDDDGTKEMTDEDVMHHLDEIENIVLDPATFGTQNTEDKEQGNVGGNGSNQEDGDADVKWYEQKLAQKEATIRERFSKLARVLEYSYPHYKKWLEIQEKQHGSPICKLNPPRRCPLDKPYSNRWKFLCSRKSVQESAKGDGNAEVSEAHKKVETIWRLEPTTTWGVKTDNHSEFPPFVMRAVKVFEDFLQSSEVQSETSVTVANDKDNSNEVVILNDKEIDEDDEIQKEKQEWSWLVVRCNSMDHLMLFATGKHIRRSTMDQLKQVFETGPGKDCNVKSLYCKSINKIGDITNSNTTFLVGSEALDEVVGGLKIQLAPKTNFWSNSAGAVNVAKAVADLLLPNAVTTVLEIGCGIGLIGLMLASKCQRVIGVDSPSEVEEAEMTCELNNIKNVSFIMGSPNEVINKITSAVKSRKTFAIINANTNIGRAITLMTALRKMNSIRRIVMITTLTKQSVRAILELTRPGDRSLGNPFMPLQACVVDTLPVGPHFEIVIRMERKMMHKYLETWENEGNVSAMAQTSSIPSTEESSGLLHEKLVINPVVIKKGVAGKANVTQGKKNLDKSPLKGPAGKKAKASKKQPAIKNIQTLPNINQKSKFAGKRPHSPEKFEAPAKKMMKKFDKFGVKNWRPDLATKKSPQLRLNPLYEKKMREHKEQSDLRERLSSNRVDPQIVQTVKEHQALLAVAKEKLSGPAPTVDVTTAKELQTMLNTILEQTNKLQNQLPRSVWDRIAPPENERAGKGVPDDVLKGRYVQETGSQDILITTPNRKFGNGPDIKEPIQKKYHNIQPLEPNLVTPSCRIGSPEIISSDSFLKHQPNRYFSNKQQNQGNTWNREKPFERNRWNDSEQLRKPMSPVRRQMSPLKHRGSPPRRFSPKRSLMNLPMRQNSPTRRHFSPPRRPPSPFRMRTSPSRRPMSPLRRPTSPRRLMSPLKKPLSPPRRLMSPPRRPITPTNRPISPSRRPMSPPRRPLSPRMMRNDRIDMMPPARQPMIPDRQRTPPPTNLPMNQRRPQSPPRRTVSPPRKFVDEWDIPSRGAIEQNMWRPADHMQEKPWRDERQSLINTQPPSNDRFRKPVNHNKWDIPNSSREDRWVGGGESWKKQQQMQQNSENRWVGGPGPSTSIDNWDIRGKDSFGKLPSVGNPSNRDDWIDKNSQRWDQLQNKDVWNKPGEKDDWNDLPEDARDPWGDEGNLGSKDNSRWSKFDNPIASSTWIRESDKTEFWVKPTDSWQNKNQQHLAKSSQWTSNNQNTNEPRWMSGNDTRHPNEMQKKSQQMGGWQSGGSSMGSWPTQSFNYQQQRIFNMNPFKDRR